MSSIGGSANKNELTHNSFLTPSTALTAILEVGNVADDIVPITGGTADEAYQALLDAVAAPSPNNPFNFDPNQSPSSTTNLLNGLKVYQVTSTSGHVLQAEIVNQGSGYSVGGAVNATSGAGTGCQVEVISVDSGAVRGVRIAANGSGYSDGDVLTISGGGGNATIRVNTVVFFKTLLYTHESHGSASFTSTLSQLKSQKIAYTGNNVTNSSTMEHGAIGINVPKIFDEPLTVVSKPTATSHRVIVGQARNPHGTLAGKKISNGGTFPNNLFGTLGSGRFNEGILYSALDIVSDDANNVLSVGDQLTFAGDIRGQVSDLAAFFAFAHVLDEDHIVLFANLKCPIAAEITGTSTPKYLTSAADRFYQGTGFEGGDPAATDPFSLNARVVANPQVLLIDDAYTSKGTLIIPTHIKRIAVYPAAHDAIVRRGSYFQGRNIMGADFDGEVIGGTISTAGTGYGTNTGVVFTTSGGRGSGFKFETNTNGGVLNTGFTITTNSNAIDNVPTYLPGEILDVVGGTGTGAKVTITTRGQFTLPFMTLPAKQVTELVVNTGEDCALTFVSTGANDVLHIQYLTG